MGSPFIFKIKFYGPGDSVKNSAHVLYIGTRPGADRGEVEIGDTEQELDEMEIAAGHVKYAAERPRSHGLFGADEKVIPDLEGVQNELRQHKGIVWRAVLSLREDDAIRMGYTDRLSWENALRAAVPEAAEKMGITELNLRWVAAFHAEAGHPHCHLMFWEAEPKRSRGVLSMGERKDVRKTFIRHIYAAERARLGAEKTALRDLLRDTGKSNIRDVLKNIRLARDSICSFDGAATGVPPRLYEEVRVALSIKLEQIADILPGKGRVALKYMPPEVKEKLHETADWLLQQPGFSDSVKRYVEIAREMAEHYSMIDDKLKEAGRKAYEDLRDRLGQDVLNGAVEVGKLEKATESLIDNRLVDSGVEPFEGEDLEQVPGLFDGLTLEYDVEPLSNDLDDDGQSSSVSGVTKLPGLDLKTVSESLVKDSWRTVGRAIFRLNSSTLRGKMPAVSAAFEIKVAEKLKTIAGLIPEDALKGRLALAYLPREVKDEVRSFAEQLLNSGEVALRTKKYMELVVAGQGEDAGNKAFRELRERVAEQVVGRAVELLPREIPQVEMLNHQGRVQVAIKRLKNASAEYICGDIEEVKWTAGAMYRALNRLGVNCQAAREATERWADSVGLKEEASRAVTGEVKRMEFISQKCRDNNKPEPVYVSRKNWTRLRENLGLEEEEYLYPWFGVVQEQEQLPEQKEAIPHELVEKRIYSAVSALETASGKPENYAEVYWTIRTLTNTLQAVGVSEKDRERIVRGWLERSGLEISEARLKDVLDRVTVSPREGFWLGRAGWVRLNVNLGVTTSAAAPWKVVFERTSMGADENKVAGELWRDAWHSTGRAIYRLKPGVCEKTPAIENDFRDMIADKLNTIVGLIPEESIKGRLALAYLPREVKDEARGFAEQLLNSGKLGLRTEKYMELVVAGQGEDAGSKAFRELREHVAEQVVGRAAELLPREIPQVEMLPHNGRIENAIERIKNASADYIRGDVDEVRWTTGSMYRSLIRLGVDSQESREITERWADSAGLKEVQVARAITEESIKMACITQECREENKPEPVHVSRRDWTRLRENLGLEEEECLYPWFGVVQESKEVQSQEPEQHQQLGQGVIPHELVEKRISPALIALENASGKPENYAEVYWTIRTLTNTLQALGAEEEDRTRIVKRWIENSGVVVSEARLRDVLDRVTVLPKDDFWLGRASWKRLTENLGIHNPPSSPWRVIVDRSGNIAGQVWKATWRAAERERTKLEAQRIMFKRFDDMRRQRVKERR